MRRLSLRSRIVLILCTILTVASDSPEGRGQVAAEAAISGRITSSSGAPLYGVDVTVTSPALQVSGLRTITDAQGNYRVLHLSAPGAYTATFVRKGFLTEVRKGMQLYANFEARINVEMQPGPYADTVNVSGLSPVVDPINTVAGTTLPSEEIAAIPRGAGLQEVLPMAPGISLAGSPDVGDSNLASRAGTITYGVLLQPTMDVEGIDVTTNHDLDTAVYLDTYGLAEVQISTSGNNADVGFPGAHIAALLKSGANEFHGSLMGDYESPSFQSNNVTPFLAAQGVTVSNPLRDYYDYSGDAGGRVVRNKLWFYTGASRQLIAQRQLGFVSGPDAAGCWTCLDAPEADLITSLWEYNLKLSYQPDASTRLIASWIHTEKYLNSIPASSTVPLPSSLVEHQPIDLWKAELDRTISPRMYVEAVGGFGGYYAHYATQPGSDQSGHPSSEELTTGLLTGAYPVPGNRPQVRYEVRGDLDYLGGSHFFRLGTHDDWEEGATRIPENEESGDYLLLFNLGLPAEVQLFNFPVTPVNRLFSQALFATDTWKLRRLALNYGVRWERYQAFYPAENKPAGQFSSAASFPGQSLLTWKDAVPRVGAAWDLFGTGKSVLKGSLGVFGDTMGDLWANTFNPDAQVTTSYTWDGPCVDTGYKNVSYDNTSCNISAATLGTLNPASPEFISAVGGLNEMNNQGLQQDKTWEIASRFEHEFAPNMAFSAGYFYHRVDDLYSSLEPTTDSTANGIQILRPYSIYTIPILLTDPLTKLPATLYTYPASYASAKFNELEIVNAPHSRPDTYHTFAMSFSKRYSKRWNLLTSFWATKDHEWIQAIQPTPNDIQFPQDHNWNWEARTSAYCFLPWRVEASAFYRSQSGIPGQRTETFSSPLLLQGPVTLRMEPFGAQRGPVIQLTNLRLAKSLTLRHALTFQANVGVYNAFNTSAATSTSYLTGPTYQHITGIVSPRVERIGLQLSF